MTIIVFNPMKNEQDILAACREYKRKATREKELYRKLNDTIGSGTETRSNWEEAKSARIAQAERILMLIETGKIR